MTSLVVISIERELKKSHLLKERDANILLATIHAQESKIKELEAKLKTAEAQRDRAEAQS